MKKIIALMLIVCTFALCLVSCASLDKYEDNLGKDYEVLNHDIEELLDDMDLDPDDYDIKDAFLGYNKDNFDYIHVIECKSSSKAKKLAKDLEDAFKEYDEDKHKVTQKGKFVLTGPEYAIDDALGK